MVPVAATAGRRCRRGQGRRKGGRFAARDVGLWARAGSGTVGRQARTWPVGRWRSRPSRPPDGSGRPAEATGGIWSGGGCSTDPTGRRLRLPAEASRRGAAGRFAGERGGNRGGGALLGRRPVVSRRGLRRRPAEPDRRPARRGAGGGGGRGNRRTRAPPAGGGAAAAAAGGRPAGRPPRRPRRRVHSP